MTRYHKRVMGNKNKDKLLVKVMNHYFETKEPKRQIHHDGRRFIKVDKFFRWLFTTTNGYTAMGKEDVSHAIIVANRFFESDFIWHDIGRGGQTMFAFMSRKKIE